MKKKKQKKFSYFSEVTQIHFTSVKAFGKKILQIHKIVTPNTHVCFFV